MAVKLEFKELLQIQKRAVECIAGKKEYSYKWKQQISHAATTDYSHISMLY